MASRFARQITNLRGYASAHGPSATAGGHGGGMKMWKILSFTVAVPGVLLCKINADRKEAEHHEHYHRPEFVPYEHLRMRTKAFPWADGKRSMFHNAHTNALPDGYEDEE